MTSEPRDVTTLASPVADDKVAKLMELLSECQDAFCMWPILCSELKSPAYEQVKAVRIKLGELFDPDIAPLPPTTKKKRSKTLQAELPL